MPFENDATNGCVGCGPANAAGLQLSFTPTTDGARAAFTASSRWEGFPGRLHSAILYLGLIEAMNWALYARTGRMGLPIRTGALATTRTIPTGTELLFEGRLVHMDEGARLATMESVASDIGGESVGRLERGYALVDEATFLARLGYKEVPPGYEGLFR
ncbi:MAG: hypothetical protein ACYDDF_05890 [Thermoplasmatota archaeon]